MKVHGRFEGNLRLQVPGKVVAECGLRYVMIKLLKMTDVIKKIGINSVQSFYPIYIAELL